MFNVIRAKLGRYGVRPSELAYITDVDTYIRCLGIANFRTLDKLGPNATLLQGQLAAVEGIPVLVSEQMAVADADGKVTSGTNVASTGRLLIVNRSQWRVGFRRDLTIETERDIQKRQKHHGGEHAHCLRRTDRHTFQRKPHGPAIQHHRGPIGSPAGLGSPI